MPYSCSTTLKACSEGTIQSNSNGTDSCVIHKSNYTTFVAILSSILSAAVMELRY